MPENESYQEKLKEFKEAMLKAIINYEKIKGIVPKHRSRNILEIKNVINASGDSKYIKEGIIKKLFGQNFKTGLQIFGRWIYGTSRSKLRTELLFILENPSYQEEAFLRAEIYDLTQEVEELRINNAKQDMKPNELEQAHTEAQKAISKLNQELYNVNNQLNQLQNINRTLTEDIKKLEEQLQKSRARYSSDMDDIHSNTSPSGGFRNSLFSSYKK